MGTAVKLQVDDIIKSQEDKRLYRGLVLQNGLKALLVSDPTTDKSAAAMDVHIGHMSDPEDLPGLAHFCEHMLFLGTEKYPEENEYHKFLNEHGGFCNAFTSADHTNFYFDVTPDHLGGALDRFAQFFRTPLFTESATDREVNAVHSEHEKNLQSDVWRLSQLEKSTSDPNHPFSKFGTGNKETLDSAPKANGLSTREQLLNFHSKWYSSNIMGFSILGKESLDELQQYVVDLFNDVPNKDVNVPSWPQHPFGEEQRRLRAYVVPVKDIRNLIITFPIPDLTAHYKSNPGHYLGHLIGHEGPGSLLSELKSRGWVNTLVGGQKSGAAGFGFFVVTVDLTEEGLEKAEEVVTCVFQYLKMLQEKGPQEWIFQECLDLGKMQFRFKDKERPQSLVCTLAGLLHDYPIDEVLSVGYLLTEWRPDLITMVMTYLIPENVRVAVAGKKFEGHTDLQEKWYGTQYKLEKLEESALEKWKNAGLNPNLRLPPKNEFVPTDFELVPREENASNVPILLQDKSMSRVWYKQDEEFLLPKAVLNFEFVSPLAYLDPLHFNMTYMFVQLFKDALNEYTYAAELAGLVYGLSNSKYGITLRIKGFNHKQHVLLEKIMEKMTNFKIDPKRFEILKESYVRGLKNFQAEQPHQQTVYYTSVLLAEHAWTKEEILEATEELTLAVLQPFIPELLSRMHLECLVYGNVTRHRAIELVELVESELVSRAKTRPLLPGQLVREREVQLGDGSHFVFQAPNTIHRSSCIENYYQCSLQATRSNVLLELLAQLLEEPCFNILRTKEQLGYIVFSGVRRTCAAQGLRVIVQSERHPVTLDQRVEAFLDSMREMLEEMSESNFECHKEALAARRLEKPKTMAGQAGRYWAEILSSQYHFERDDVEVAYLYTLTKNDIIEFYKELIAHDSTKRHKLSVQVISQAPGGAGDPELQRPPTANDEETRDGLRPPPVSNIEPTLIEDVTSFKSSLGLFPLVKPYINVGVMSTRAKL